MNIKDQVCSLESAKRLYDLGIKQDSLFYWMHNKANVQPDEVQFYKNTASWKSRGKVESSGVIEYISAFTVAELGEMLPEMIDKLQILTWKKTWRGSMTYFCEHRDTVFSADTEAEARAKMLIYLLENKLVAVEQTTQ